MYVSQLEIEIKSNLLRLIEIQKEILELLKLLEVYKEVITKMVPSNLKQTELYTKMLEVEQEYANRNNN